MKRSLTCPQCGARVRIPWFWAIGIEGIFRCRQCRLPFKTGYKTGRYPVGGFAEPEHGARTTDGIRIQHLFNDFFALLLIPLWIFIAFHLRRAYMIRKIKKEGLNRLKNRVLMLPKRPASNKRRIRA